MTYKVIAMGEANNTDALRFFSKSFENCRVSNAVRWQQYEWMTATAFLYIALSPDLAALTKSAQD